MSSAYALNDAALDFGLTLRPSFCPPRRLAFLSLRYQFLVVVATTHPGVDGGFDFETLALGMGTLTFEAAFDDRFDFHDCVSSVILERREMPHSPRRVDG